MVKIGLIFWLLILINFQFSICQDDDPTTTTEMAEPENVETTTSTALNTENSDSETTTLQNENPSSEDITTEMITYTTTSGDGVTFQFQAFAAPIEDPILQPRGLPISPTGLNIQPVLYTSSVVSAVPFGILENQEGKKIRKRCQCVQKKVNHKVVNTKFVPLNPVINLPGERRNFTCNCSFLKKV